MLVRFKMVVKNAVLFWGIVRGKKEGRRQMIICP
jgi:hypothetical protein